MSATIAFSSDNTTNKTNLKSTSDASSTVPNVSAETFYALVSKKRFAPNILIKVNSIILSECLELMQFGYLDSKGTNLL
jgi:hypothetical protein